MKIPNLAQLESESLMKSQMRIVKGGGGEDVVPTICLSCFCPEEGKDLASDTTEAAIQSGLQVDPD